jgi:hypothetical protein
VAGATFVLVDATILYQAEHRRPAPWPSTRCCVGQQPQAVVSCATGVGRRVAGWRRRRRHRRSRQRQHDECKDAVLRRTSASYRCTRCPRLAGAAGKD